MPKMNLEILWEAEYLESIWKRACIKWSITFFACSKANSKNSVVNISWTIFTIFRGIDTFFIESEIFNNLRIMLIT